MAFVQEYGNNIKDQYINTIKSEEAKFENPNMALSDKKMVIFSNFFAVDIQSSTANEGTLDIMEYIGSQSPIKFHEIRDLVGYGFTTEYKTKSNDEYRGFIYTKKGETLFLYFDGFEPLEGSFFITYLDNQAMLYIVTGVEELLDKDRTLWKISHEPYCDKNDPKYSYIKNQVIRISQYMADNVGTTNKVLMSIDEYNRIVEDANTLATIQAKYLKAFYKKELNTYVCDMNSSDELIYHSPLVAEFLIRTETLYSDKFSVNMQIDHQFLIPRDYDAIFDNSLYGKLLLGVSIGNEDLLFTKTKYKDEFLFSFFTKNGKKNVMLVDRDPTTLQNIDIYGYDAMKDDYLKDMRKLDPLAPNSVWDLILLNINDPIKVRDYVKTLPIMSTDIYAYMLLPVAIYVVKYGNKKANKQDYDNIISDLLGFSNY